jgi:hypothetical protein
MGNRACLVWIALLSAIESMDIMTTDLGRARGAVESMPISAAVINHGGMMLFVVVKVALVIAVAAAVLLALRWMRRGREGASILYSFTLSSIRIATVALAIVCLHNAVLIKSLQS